MKHLAKYLDTTWALIFDDFINKSKEYKPGYHEAIAFSYKFNPNSSAVMSYNSSIFSVVKAAAMYFWYKFYNPTDTSIINFFDEYKHCIDNTHTEFNSNYGIYAYEQRGLKHCVDTLIKDQNSRQAMFCINNNEAMSERSIDKLCTNTIQFFIRDNRLQMVVQMRSSNFLTLLPYDAFMFSVFYAHVFNALNRRLHCLEIGHINMQVASLHLYDSDIDKITERQELKEIFINPRDNNWQVKLERRLLDDFLSSKTN